MPLLAFVLFVFAAAIFLIVALGMALEKINLLALALCIFTVAVICQFTVHGKLVS